MSDFEEEKKRLEELKNTKLKDRLDKNKPDQNIESPSAPIMPCIKCHKSHKKGSRCPPR